MPLKIIQLNKTGIDLWSWITIKESLMALVGTPTTSNFHHDTHLFCKESFSIHQHLSLFAFLSYLSFSQHIFTQRKGITIRILLRSAIPYLLNLIWNCKIQCSCYPEPCKHKARACVLGAAIHLSSKLTTPASLLCERHSWQLMTASSSSCSHKLSGRNHRTKWTWTDFATLQLAGALLGGCSWR